MGGGRGRPRGVAGGGGAGGGDRPGGVAGGGAGDVSGCQLLELNVNHLQGLHTRQIMVEFVIFFTEYFSKTDILFLNYESVVIPPLFRRPADRRRSTGKK